MSICIKCGRVIKSGECACATVETPFVAIERTVLRDTMTKMTRSVSRAMAVPALGTQR
jgi:hypothetical protein